jgi:predicted phage terminase large subunit-like protein
MWPMWEWLRNPAEKFLCASYSGNLSIRDNLKARRLVQSPWYQERWGHSFELSGDQNAKQRFENDKTGYRLATSVGGTATGEGGSRLILDDPHSAQEAQSDAIRESALEWFDVVWSTRLNDPKRDAMVTVMQRLHHKDISGHILELGGWEHLMIPAQWDGVHRITSLGAYDPRTKDGELICPERFGEKEVADLKRQLGTYGAAGQLQQNPVPREGAMFAIKWFANRYSEPPDRSRFIRLVQSWDTAKKDSELNDYSVCTTWGETSTGYYLLDVFRQRLQFPDLLRAARSQYDKWQPTGVLIEDASSGTSLIQQLRRETSMPVIPVSPRGLSKEVRAAAVSPIVESGRVSLPEHSAWLIDFEQELGLFPVGANDDQVDSFTQFLNWAAQPAEIFVG